jgi:anaerobic selenocysteine-containing dehydrogenase
MRRPRVPATKLSLVDTQEYIGPSTSVTHDFFVVEMSEAQMSPDDHPAISRRALLQRAAIGTAGVAAAPLLGAPASAAHERSPASETVSEAFDFTADSDALQADKIVDSACQFCNCLCRLKVHLRAGRIIGITGEPADPVQAGGFCVKGPMMTQLVYNRLRLTRPLKRIGGAKGSADSKFEPVSWDEALGIIARKLIDLRDAGEARAIANKTSGRLPRGTGSLVHRFFRMLGSPNDTDVGPVCNDAGGDALAWTFGLPVFTNGYGKDGSTGQEDLGSARYLLFFGTNQAETQPVTFASLLRSREKTGAALVVVDPRRTPTAHYADQWLAPKPHTDMALVLGMLHHIVTNNLHDAAFVSRWVTGFDELKKHLVDHQYTPEWASGVCDLPVEIIRKVAHDYATTRPAAIFCNAGVSHQVGAFDTYRLLAFLAAITGNIGVAGAGCNFMHNTWPGALNLPPIQGAVPNIDSPGLPVGPDWFASAILEQTPYELKAILTCGNPLVGSSNTQKVRDAFSKLNFYVYTGLFMEEAAYYADVILPVCSGLEMETVYMRRDDRGIRWQHQAVLPVGESLPDWQIWIELAKAMSVVDKKNPPEYWTGNFPAQWSDYRNLWATFVQHTPGMGGMTTERMEQRVEPLRWPCPSLDHAGVSTMYLDHPSWYRAAESLDPANKGKRFLTPSGKVEIFTTAIQRKLPVFYTHPDVTGDHPTLHYQDRWVENPVNPGTLTPLVTLRADAKRDNPKQFPLMATTGRASVVHFSEVTHWTYTGKQMNGIRLVQIHPETAAGAGIKNGEQIKIESPRGSITATASLFDGIRPDTIFIPNGFGPMQTMALELGTPLYEPLNVLIDDRHFDNLSGQQAYKCFACRISKV